ncbi:bifunctional 2-polyprenyl-6-hydroxyphenol methylase/3-demethylubiquinol 3-O-methyltransferase UbiG [Lewinella sp. JB7]|uniref:class I SAM-dependent methyltransferase n=1 Tax=Lewinella sp. JB7 TaxID=2962887 RepID=UPI0020C9C0C0|nr:class I SAM-dependent methyltransferase [Lewinella sp. JB7]MCP9236384.1 class I SAM-dependent methyltransferase [Lewinella sp. JB7]
MTSRPYEGDELELFRGAVCWKRYWAGKVAPFVRGSVLEVGAGMGANAAALTQAAGSAMTGLTLLEPDPELARRAKDEIAGLSVPAQVRTGTLADLSPAVSFDTIMYIDVLEHIREDRAELTDAGRRLRPGGHLIVLVPAFDYLYTEFDRRIGHFRRYDKSRLRSVVCPGVKEKALFYLDSAGWGASVANRLFLKQSLPTPRQIAFWDNFLVWISACSDPILGRFVGKSLIGVWEKV